MAKSNFRISDFLIVVFFLFLASVSIFLFRQDLLQTLSIQNKEPAGIVIIKKNIVQRRLGDRVLWDRLANESPVYLGDLIRVADVSSAVLDIEHNSIDLDENTLVRITLSPDGEGYQIELTSGKISVSSKIGGKGISLDLNGQQIKTSPGTVLSASAGEKGVSLNVSSGKANIIKSGNSREDNSRGAPPDAGRGVPLRELPRDTPGREVSSGESILMDWDGNELYEKTAVVLQPVLNARYLKSSNEPVPVDFEWNRYNLPPDEKLRLDIALDKNFKQVVRAVNGLDRRTKVPLDTGLWYWRLTSGNTVLSDGRITVADGSGIQLISPAVNSRFGYQNEQPVLNFQWSREEDAVSYIMEVSKMQNFSSVQIRAQTANVNYTESSLGEGTWYWRVMPVFPAVYSGSASFSQPSFFRIEKNSIEQAALEKNNLEEYIAAVTPPRLDLPPDVPKKTAPPAASAAPAATAVKPPPKPETRVENKKPELRLLLPAQNAKLDGLTVMRKQTVFTWETSGKVVRSRFVLSRNPNPLQGRAAVEIQNPGRTVRLDNLAEGVWYWTVEARTNDGFTITAPSARQFQVLPIPLLPMPVIVRPSAGQRYGFEDLRPLKNLVFEWKAVKDANAYIFSLYQQTENGRRQIVGTSRTSGTSFTLDNLKVLENGTFIWQLEAVSAGRNGVIDRRGRVGEYSFVLDFPPPEPVEIEDTGVLYGN